MNEFLEKCNACNARLYDVVRHCPYCGKAILGSVAEPLKGKENSVSPSSKIKPITVVVPARDEPPLLDAAPVPVKAKAPVVPPAAIVEKKSRAILEEKPEVPYVAVEPNSKKSGGKGGIFVAVVLVAAVGLYFVNKSSKQDEACNQLLTITAEKLAAGDAVGARNQSVLALASCDGENRTKAVDMQAASEKILNLQSSCERSFRSINTQVTERRLQSARSALDQLDTACVESLKGKDLLLQIESGQAGAIAAEAEVQKLLTDGDVKAAATALDQMGKQNREHPDLAALRQEVQTAAKLQEAKAAEALQEAQAAAKLQEAAIAPTPALKTPEVPSPVIRESATVRPPPTAVTPQSAINPQAELMQSFLRDAATAMNQQKFDAAKTYVESARRISPNNPQAEDMARRIKAREMEYLRKEMTIN